MTKNRQATQRPRSVDHVGSRTTAARRARRGGLWGWLALAIPFAVLAFIVIVGGGEVGGQAAEGATAPDFELPTTAGGSENLSAVLAEGDALLYFSMGVGCDGCFAQIPEIGAALAERGVRLVPVMVDPPDVVAREASRFAIDMPILIDSDRAVSAAYDMIGVYGHADRPSHSFAYVEQDRTISWVGHYAEMFVPLEALLAELPGGA